jgi:transcriptional regulator with XRE-family HTH domain
MATRRISQTNPLNTTVLGELIKQSRQKAKLTQQQLGEKLELTQTTISAWEGGKYFPALEQLPELAEALGLSVDQLNDAYETEEYQEKGFETSEAIYVKEQQQYIRQIGASNIEIFLLGPRSLPVISSEVVQDIWVENLLAGASYSIIWYLDFMESSDFRKIGSVLGKIDRKIRETVDKLQSRSDVHLESLQEAGHPCPGKINHYAITFTGEKDTNHRLAPVMTAMETLKNSGLDASNEFWPLLPVHLPELLQYYVPFGSLVLYRDHRSSFVNAPLTSLTLPKICQRPSRLDGDAGYNRLFCFLSDYQSANIDDVIQLFLRRYGDVYGDEMLERSSMKASNSYLSADS